MPDMSSYSSGGQLAERDRSEKKAQLEQRYIELLERRIAALEESLSSKVVQGDVRRFSDAQPYAFSAAEHAGTPKGGDANGVHEGSGFEALRSLTLRDEAVETKPGQDEQTNSSPCHDSTGSMPPELQRVRFRETHIDEFGLPVHQPGNVQSTAGVEQQQEQSRYAFAWYKTFDNSKKYTGSAVEIESLALRELLKANLSFCSSFAAHDEIVRMSGDFRPIVHNWCKLLDVAEAGSDDDEDEQKQAKMDLKLLMNLVRATPMLESYFKSNDGHRQPKTITFDYLWIIFPPGCLVYSAPVLKQDQVFILQNLTYGQLENGKDCLILTCWSYDWDGESFERVAYDLKIERFSGSKSVESLEHYPLESHRDKDGNLDCETLRKKLIDRGKRFCELCLGEKGCQMFDYRGLAISDHKGITRPETASPYDDLRSVNSDFADEKRISALDAAKAKSLEIRERVIVDFSSYIYYVSGDGIMGALRETEPYTECTCPSCWETERRRNTFRLRYDRFRNTKNFADEQYMILPPRVLGYAMRTKIWGQLLVNNVRNVRYDKEENTFKKLVLAKSQKKLIESLVSKHGELNSDGGDANQLEDLVEGKGKGLVILLHGPPGVGKTLTAEAVAQVTRKPLFAVSVADIGLEPSEVEKNLSKLFNLAARWKAILLFDEADVFLEARETQDIKRNALVSVLLRVMEYYEGILILTTNRIKTFDLAVQSRVHLAIRYTDLSHEDRKAIFCNFFEQLNNDNTADKAGLKRWVDDEFDDDFNGRQIRNVLSSAMAVARGRGDKLQLKDVKEVVKTTREFQKYLMEESLKARQRME